MCIMCIYVYYVYLCIYVYYYMCIMCVTCCQINRKNVITLHQIWFDLTSYRNAFLSVKVAKLIILALFRQPIAGLLGARFLPLDERSFCMSSGHIPLHRRLVNRLSTIIVSGYSAFLMHGTGELYQTFVFG